MTWSDRSYNRRTRLISGVRLDKSASTHPNVRRSARVAEQLDYPYWSPIDEDVLSEQLDYPYWSPIDEDVQSEQLDYPYWSPTNGNARHIKTRGRKATVIPEIFDGMAGARREETMVHH